VPSFPELEPPLSDGEVIVRLAAERDIPEVLIAYQDDPELHLRMGEERPPSGAELGRLAERAAADRAAGRGMTLTIVAVGDDDGVCLGQVNVHQVDWEHARLELGIWVVPQARGRGFGRKALRLLARWLLEELDFERVQLLTEPDNQPMLAAAAGAGFEREGTFRGFTRERGHRVDVAILSLVRRDLGG